MPLSSLKPFTRITYLIIPTLIIIIASIYYLRDINLNRIVNLVALKPSVYWVIFFSFTVSTLIIISINKIFLHDFEFDADFYRIALILWVSGASNYLFFAKFGIPVRVYLLKQLLHIPYRISISVKIIIIWLTLISIIISGLIGSILSNELPPIVVKNIIVFGIIGFFILIIIRFLSFEIKSRIHSEINLFSKIIKYSIECYNAFNKVSVKPQVIAFMGLIIKSMIYAYVSFIIINSISENTVSIYTVWAIQAVNSVVSLFSILPGGLGTKELSLIFLFNLSGIGKEEALVLAAYERLIWVVPPIIFGFISGGILGIFSNENKRKTLETSGII